MWVEKITIHKNQLPECGVWQALTLWDSATLRVSGPARATGDPVSKEQNEQTSILPAPLHKHQNPSLGWTDGQQTSPPS